MKMIRFGNVTMACREGTCDESVLKQNFEENIFFKGVPEYRPKPGDIIIDVGAHIGAFAISASARLTGGKVYAIEPSGESFEYLKKNIALNGIQNISAHKLALSDFEGDAKLYINPKDGNWANTISKKVSGEYETVKVDTLDNFMRGNGIEKCDFMKVNCEGSEFEIILNTSREGLRRIETILVLYHLDMNESHTEKDLIKYLRKCGYFVVVRNKSALRGWIIAGRNISFYPSAVYHTIQYYVSAFYNRLRRRLRPGRAALVLGFVFISLVFIYLRAKTLGHLLIWDEARNIISLRAFLGNNTSDPFYRSYFFHPPLYMAFAGLLFPFKAAFAIRLELLSMLFSYAALSIVYLLSARIGGWRYAFLSGLFLSVMPASIAHDTWVKRDGLASALGYLAILLLVKKRFLWCAVALSFSLLTKENALFFILAATAVLFMSKEKKWPKKILAIYGVIFILSAWWYLFFSAMPGIIFDIYFSVEKNASAWAASPWYYLKKLLPDLGLPVLLFFIIGIIYISYRTFRKRQYRLALPLVIALCVYIPASFIIACKTPWLSSSALPALAMIAGCGGSFLWKKAARSRAASAVLAILVTLSVFYGFSFSYEKYHMGIYPNGWSGANTSRSLAAYLNDHMRSGERLMLTEWTTPFCPVFLYYWKGGEIYIISARDSAGDIIGEIVKNRVSWFAIIDSPDRRLDFRTLIKNITDSSLGNPAIIGRSYIWETDALWKRRHSDSND